MTVPAGFAFSQASLQDFVDCRRRFYLRHLQRLAWPAVESEPALENERYQQQGQAFHRLAHQALLGIPLEAVDRLAQGDDLQPWWQNFQASLPKLLAGSSQHYPEVTLRTDLNGFTLTAKCDLVVFQPEGHVLIYDWKTSRRRTSRLALAARLQTRVYPYLLARLGACLNGGLPVQPEQVEMVYWFAGFPTQPECFPYSRQQFQADQAYLCSLIQEIAALPEEGFLETGGAEMDRFCLYRSLCDRGVEAGLADDLSEDGDLAGTDFDFEQVIEIEY